ncbi:hypothetical protein [Pseudochrobactrum saccharolyticum]|uniref:hypothetical protein n=1 Tax=Pseudochrobactrum saccharolyticum TaxID=354352 RepID=UPI00276A3C93|nr:hypothetical protein [Pseudochrobactrum saccharolyticum]MDP8250963.1 hypothetical protein [Pseudochrobactrum saccharolyticum]
MIRVLSTELKDQEIYIIGSIVSQWGFLEADIFDQTLQTFIDEKPEFPLPKQMNNLKFTEVLNLWLKRVAEIADKPKKLVLKNQYERIIFLNDYRQAIVHSRWQYNPSSPQEITAVRIRKKEIVRVKFTFEDLLNLSQQLGEIRYNINYPGGEEDRLAKMPAWGYMSRKFNEIMSGNDVSEG